MSQPPIELSGTLREDGTLVFDEKPALPPGRVKVTVQPEVPTTVPPHEDWWQYLQRARQELEAANYPFMNEEELTAWIEELRADDDRIEKAYGHGVE